MRAGYEPEGRVFESLRAHQTTPNDLVTYGQIRNLRFYVQTRTVPTQSHPGFFHRGPRVVFLRMHLPFRD